VTFQNIDKNLPLQHEGSCKVSCTVEFSLTVWLPFGGKNPDMHLIGD
jgi:hypothetical protein